MLLQLPLVVVSLVITTIYGVDFVYHDFDHVTAYLNEVAESHPNITHLYSIGESVEGNVVNYIF